MTIRFDLISRVTELYPSQTKASRDDLVATFHVKPGNNLNTIFPETVAVVQLLCQLVNSEFYDVFRQRGETGVQNGHHLITVDAEAGTLSLCSRKWWSQRTLLNFRDIVLLVGRIHGWELLT